MKTCIFGHDWQEFEKVEGVPILWEGGVLSNGGKAVTGVHSNKLCLKCGARKQDWNLIKEQRLVEFAKQVETKSSRLEEARRIVALSQTQEEA